MRPCHARLVPFCFAVLLLVGCGDRPPVMLHQFGLLDALKAGRYGCLVDVADLPRQGTIGLGTFEGLDGEMVVVDGVVHRVDASGKARPAPDDLGVPYATVARFEPRQRRTVESLDLPALARLLDSLAPDGQRFAAVRIRGRFAHLVTRSVPRQPEPWPDLATALQGQTVTTREEASGVLVGFRFPRHAAAYGVTSWHLHYLSMDHRQGGHVLDLRVDRAMVESMQTERMLLIAGSGEAIATAGAEGGMARE